MVKRDGERERFDRQKLLRGLARAAGGRPVSADQLEAVAAWIAEEAARRGGGEAQAERIGDLAERGLARVDPVSAIQFASVYRNLADLDQLEAVVRRFKDDPPGRGPARHRGARSVRPEEQHWPFPQIVPAQEEPTRATPVQQEERSCPTAVAPQPERHRNR